MKSNGVLEEFTNILQKTSKSDDQEEEKCYILTLKGRSGLIIHVHKGVKFTAFAYFLDMNYGVWFIAKPEK